MKVLALTFLIFSIQSISYCQKVSYYPEIENIIISKCASCHQKGGYGPFPLTNYEEVKNKGSFIGYVTRTKYMPPWKADPTFQSFKNQRILSEEEIKKIGSWIESGMPKGKRKGKKPEIQDIVENREADLVLSMSKPYVLSDSSVEDYRFFNVPTNLSTDKYLESIEFIPGNKRQLHHARIMTDTSNAIRGIDGLSEFDPKAKKFQTIPLEEEFLYGWVPGNLPIFYPPGTGKKIYANTDLIFNIHYAPTSKEEQDLSKVKLFFTKEPVNNEIKSLTIREEHISNQPFFIPKATTPTFYVSYTVEEDINVVSILPHMHYLGKSFKALAVTPSGSALPLIKIDEWDFNWQSSYLMEEPLLIPKGSVILITAMYDNTSNNSANPNNPVKDVGYGWNSTDEMMNFVIYYY